MRRPMMTLLTTTCLALPVAQAAWAIDTPVAGSKLSVSDPVPVVTKRSLSFTLQDVAISLTGVDPTATGVSVP